MSAGFAVAWAAFCALVVIGAVVLAWWLRMWAEDRARERRYADEWVRRHRSQGRP